MLALYFGGIFCQDVAEPGKCQIRFACLPEHQVILPDIRLFVKGAEACPDTRYCLGCLCGSIQALKAEDPAVFCGGACRQLPCPLACPLGSSLGKRGSQVLQGGLRAFKKFRCQLGGQHIG